MDRHEFLNNLNLDQLNKIFQDELMTIPNNKFGVVGKPSWAIPSPDFVTVDLAIVSSFGEILDSKTFEHPNFLDTLTELKNTLSVDPSFVFLEKTTKWLFKNTNPNDQKKILEELTTMMLLDSTDFSKLPVC